MKPVYILATVIGFFILAAISGKAIAHQSEVDVAENKTKDHYMLGILGYNYTDEEIDQFSVDGHGGGNIHVSSPTSGGGGTVCCVMLSKNPKWPIKVNVRWQSGGCSVFVKNHKYSHTQYYFKDEIINVEQGTNLHPTDIAVHFYKDGTVRAILVDGVKSPLLILPEKRALNRQFPECKVGEPVDYL